MKKEIRIFFTALMFYTRIPCPKWVDHSAEYINKSTRYFPLIGWIVGAIATLFLVGGSYALTIALGVILSMAASILTTGAFHEDGFADMCDGFGGGWTKEQILNIMKDSRLGTYGAVGLFLILLMKFTLTLEVLDILGIYESVLENWLLVLLFMVSAHSVSRFTASTFIISHDYVQDIDVSKVKPVAKSLPWKDVSIAAIWGLIPLVAFGYYTDQWYVLLSLVPVFIAKLYLGRLFNKKIQGYTGDCLGAAQQVTEVVFLASIFAIWKFI